MFLSTNGHNSENPVEDSLPNGSHAVNGSPGPPQKHSDKDASSETSTGTGTGTETPSEQENWGRSSSKTSLLLSSKMFLSPNGHNSENPVEDSLPNGSHAVNGSPGPPQERSDEDASSETGTGTGTGTETPSEQENWSRGFFKEMRGWLMIVAILAAGSTYQAGLNPPGGVWQTDDEIHGFVAGTPVLHDKFFRRYQAFFYCNAISFLSSLVIIILLINKNFYRDSKKIKVLEITMVLDLFSFMAAYAAGSCRLVTTSIFIFLLMGGVFAYVISFAYHYSFVGKIISYCLKMMPCTKPCVQTTEQPRGEDIV